MFFMIRNNALYIPFRKPLKNTTTATIKVIIIIGKKLLERSLSNPL